MEHRAEGNGAQALTACALYRAGRNAYPTYRQECLSYLNAQPNCHFGIIGKIGSEGVCAVYEERRVG